MEVFKVIWLLCAYMHVNKCIQTDYDFKVEMLIIEKCLRKNCVSYKHLLYGSMGFMAHCCQFKTRN